MSSSTLSTWHSSDLSLNPEGSRIFDMKKIKDRIDMWMFHLMNSISKLSVDELEHFVNLAFFSDILKALRAIHITTLKQDGVFPAKGPGDTVGAENPAMSNLLPKSASPDFMHEIERRRESTYYGDLRLNGLRDFYTELFQSLHRKFKDNILKKFKIDFEFRKDLVDYAMFTDLCEEVHQDLASKNFYSSINHILLENWFKYRAKKGKAKMDIGLSDEEFENKQASLIEMAMSVSLYSLFATADSRNQPKLNLKPKQTKFKDTQA